MSKCAAFCPRLFSLHGLTRTPPPDWSCTATTRCNPFRHASPNKEFFASLAIESCTIVGSVLRKRSSERHMSSAVWRARKEESAKGAREDNVKGRLRSNENMTHSRTLYSSMQRASPYLVSAEPIRVERQPLGSTRQRRPKVGLGNVIGRSGKETKLGSERQAPAGRPQKNAPGAMRPATGPDRLLGVKMYAMKKLKLCVCQSNNHRKHKHARVASS